MNPELRQEMERFDREFLAGIPTLFGRIVYLSSLREGAAYRDPRSDTPLAPNDARAVLSKLHCDLIIAWLRWPMEQRYDDFRQYLATIRNPTIREKWLRLANIAALLPEDLGAVDRELFMSEFHVLLAILRRGKSR